MRASSSICSSTRRQASRCQREALSLSHAAHTCRQRCTLGLLNVRGAVLFLGADGDLSRLSVIWGVRDGYQSLTPPHD